MADKMAKYRTEIQQVRRKETLLQCSFSFSSLHRKRTLRGSTYIGDLKRLSLAIKFSNSLARGWALFSIVNSLCIYVFLAWICIVHLHPQRLVLSSSYPSTLKGFNF